MNIVVFEVEPWERSAFDSLMEAHDVSFDSRAVNREVADEYADADVISTFIYSDLRAQTLQQFESLKLIATRSTGFDHIDADYCKETGIRVANVPSYGENTVAEHVFALLLATSHRIVEATDRTRRGDFSQDGLRGFDLKGRTMGVIGTGRIGLHVTRIAKGFGMPVVAYDVQPDEKQAEELAFEYLDLNELLRRSDVVSLHVPASDGTQHMISAEQFEQMKDGVVLINTSRGSVIDTRALLDALAGGKLAAAGLDVLPEEPVIREESELLRSAFSGEHNLEMLLADHILLRLRNVVITPHSAFNTTEAVRRILDTTRDTIEAYCAEQPQNLVVS